MGNVANFFFLQYCQNQTDVYTKNILNKKIPVPVTLYKVPVHQDFNFYIYGTGGGRYRYRYLFVVDFSNSIAGSSTAPLESPSYGRPQPGF